MRMSESSTSTTLSASGHGISQRATVLLIEHNMRVVLNLARRVTVMEAGAIIAEGTPAEIEANAAVQKAYLGK